MPLSISTKTACLGSRTKTGVGWNCQQSQIFATSSVQQKLEHQPTGNFISIILCCVWEIDAETMNENIWTWMSWQKYPLVHIENPIQIHRCIRNNRLRNLSNERYTLTDTETLKVCDTKRTMMQTTERRHAISEELLKYNVMAMRLMAKASFSTQKYTW